jgi:hypothetical protein
MIEAVAPQHRYEQGQVAAGQLLQAVTENPCGVQIDGLDGPRLIDRHDAVGVVPAGARLAVGLHGYLE